MAHVSLDTDVAAASELELLEAETPPRPPVSPSPSTKRQRRSLSPPESPSPAVERDDDVHSRRRGPTNLREVIDFTGRFLADLHMQDVANGTSFFQNAQRRLASGILLTTSYSGMGGTETAAVAIGEAFVGCLRGSTMAAPAPPLAQHQRPPVYCYSACDKMVLAQRCLQNHTTATRPAHLFADITQRFKKNLYKKPAEYSYF
jgi:hypothetical protein